MLQFFWFAALLALIGADTTANSSIQTSDGSSLYSEHDLEALAYKYGTDKSHDDHKYVDAYTTFFHHRRHAVRNMTEIGVAAGQSLQVWNEYFPRALIHGIDLQFEAAVVRNLSPLRRVTLHGCDVSSATKVLALGFAPETMDVIIDDGPHRRAFQENNLANFWSYLKPGGIYIIEVRKTIPSNCKRTNIKSNRVYIGKINHINIKI